MSFPDLERRVALLELAGLLRNPAPPKFKNRSSGEWLHELADAIWQVKELALAAGDYRTALTSIDLLCTLLQLRARLGGELHDLKATQAVEVNLDPARGDEIAKMYLTRQERSKARGGVE